MSKLPENFILPPEYERVAQLCTNPGSVILVSGKAGTGKSVLIDYITELYTHLNVVKVAPTGVAAINIEGATIHSVFKLPLQILTPSLIKSHIQQIYMNMTSRNTMQTFFKSIHILVIEEISMVRADTLDCMDEMMRKLTGRNMPFGGIVVLMVGDLLQLSPIVRNSDIDEFIACGYDTAYFFSSRVMQKLLSTKSMTCVDLVQVRRQNDEIFLQLLNNIRNSENIDFTMQVINGACYHNRPAIMDRTAITVCTTNDISLSINQKELSKLPGPSKTYTGSLEGTFKRDTVLSPDELELKINARVMFTKNHPNGIWVNGTMGTVTSFAPNSGYPMVLIDGDKLPVAVDLAKWENARYDVRKKSSSDDHNDDIDHKIDRKVLGSYTQIPLMLAYACTTHKVQGLTFNKMNINTGNGMFATGQLYVAFSRGRTIEGITLERPITRSDFKTDPVVLEFYNQISSNEVCARQSAHTTNDILDDQQSKPISEVFDILNAMHREGNQHDYEDDDYDDDVPF